MKKLQLFYNIKGYLKVVHISARTQYQVINGLRKYRSLQDAVSEMECRVTQKQLKCEMSYRTAKNIFSASCSLYFSQPQICKHTTQV